MPRTVRNFWVEASIDGRSSILSGGPKSKGGGFDLDISVRNDGGVESDVIRISGQECQGKLILTVHGRKVNKAIVFKNGEGEDAVHEDCDIILSFDRNR